MNHKKIPAASLFTTINEMSRAREEEREMNREREIEGRKKGKAGGMSESIAEQYVIVYIVLISASTSLKSDKMQAFFPQSNKQ